ncbi:MAG: hypothetical protein ACRDBL_04610 [Rhabdaerophilum sp.]
MTAPFPHREHACQASFVPDKGKDAICDFRYTLEMSKPAHDWYLREWLAALDCTVTELRERTEWTHRIASQLVNRKLRWNRDHLSQAATALRLDAWELLMHPSDAMEVRQLRAQVLRAAEKRSDYVSQPADLPVWGKTGS